MTNRERLFWPPAGKTRAITGALGMLARGDGSISTRNLSHSGDGGCLFGSIFAEGGRKWPFTSIVGSRFGGFAKRFDGISAATAIRG